MIACRSVCLYYLLEFDEGECRCQLTVGVTISINLSQKLTWFHRPFDDADDVFNSTNGVAGGDVHPDLTSGQWSEPVGDVQSASPAFRHLVPSKVSAIGPGDRQMNI